MFPAPVNAFPCRKSITWNSPSPSNAKGLPENVLNQLAGHHKHHRQRIKRDQESKLHLNVLIVLLVILHTLKMVLFRGPVSTDWIWELEDANVSCKMLIISLVLCKLKLLYNWNKVQWLFGGDSLLAPPSKKLQSRTNMIHWCVKGSTRLTFVSISCQLSNMSLRMHLATLCMQRCTYSMSTCSTTIVVNPTSQPAKRLLANFQTNGV